LDYKFSLRKPDIDNPRLRVSMYAK